MHFQALAKARLVADQPPQFSSEGVGQGIGKRSEQHPGIRAGAGEKDRPVQGDDCFPRARRA